MALLSSGGGGSGYQAACSVMVFGQAQESQSKIFLMTSVDFTQDPFCLPDLGFTLIPCSTLLSQGLLEESGEESFRV